MRWFKKPSDRSSGRDGDETVEPTALEISADRNIFAVKLSALLENLGGRGGIDACLAALADKSQLFEESLHPAELDSLDRSRLELLLETVMPARKRLGAAFGACDEQDLVAAVKDLLFGDAELSERMNNFVAAFPEVGGDDKVNNKARRAAWDFAAELLHFRAPERYPLMASWIWEPGSRSGVLRSLLTDGDVLKNIAVSNVPGVYAAVRQWVAQLLAEHGLHAEPHFAVDVFLAHVYADNLRARSTGADAAANGDPMEPIRTLLGIDAMRGRRSSRVRASRPRG